MSTSLSKLKNLPFWQNLSLSEQEIMSNCVQIRRYQKDELIYSHDHECLGLIKILSGEIRTFMLSDEGREIVLYRLKAGDTDVLSASCVVNQITFETQMVAESDCEILIIPAVYLSGFKENNLYVRCFIFEKLGERFSDVMSQMQKILFTPVEVRLSGFDSKLSAAVTDAEVLTGLSVRGSDCQNDKAGVKSKVDEWISSLGLS